MNAFWKRKNLCPEEIQERVKQLNKNSAVLQLRPRNGDPWTILLLSSLQTLASFPVTANRPLFHIAENSPLDVGYKSKALKSGEGLIGSTCVWFPFLNEYTVARAVGSRESSKSPVVIRSWWVGRICGCLGNITGAAP